MKPIESIHEKIRLIFENITNEAATEEYFNSIDESNRESFEGIITTLIELQGNIERNSTDPTYIPDTCELRNQVEYLHNLHPLYKASSYDSSILTCIVAQRIRSLLGEGQISDYDTDISESEWQSYKMNRLIEPPDRENYIYLSANNDSIIFVRTDRLIDFKDNVLPQCADVYLLLKFLRQLPFDDFTGHYCFCHNSYTDMKIVTSFLDLQRISIGRMIHSETTETRKTCIPHSSNFRISADYRQFQEITYILSEYNSKHDILDKYLRIYQVLENLMFRKPICELVNVSSPKMFSIRDFKRLYNSIQENELSSLHELNKALFNSDINLQNLLFQKFETYRSGLDPGVIRDLDDYTKSFTKKCSPITDVDKQAFAQWLSKIVYGLRNAIVHNKETEMHFTHNNLPDVLKEFLKCFLLESLEILIFHLLIEKNPIISYAHPDIKLFDL